VDTTGKGQSERQYSLQGLLGYITVSAALLSIPRTLAAIGGSLPPTWAILFAPFILAWWMAVGGWIGFGICCLVGRKRHRWRYAGTCALLIPLLGVVIAGFVRASASRGPRPISPEGAAIIQEAMESEQASPSGPTEKITPNAANNEPRQGPP
jgi:hypothetical protein